MTPIPVSTFGVLGYLALLVVAVMSIQPRWSDSGAIRLMLVGGATIGVAFSAYLTYIEAFVLHAWCQWCVISAIIMALIFLATLPELRRAR